MTQLALPYELIDLVLLKFGCIDLLISLRRAWATKRIIKWVIPYIDSIIQPKTFAIDALLIVKQYDLPKYDIMVWTSYYGYLSNIRYLYNIGIECKSETMFAAAINNQLDVVKYLRSIGVECDYIKIMSIVTERGHLSVLQYLYTCYMEYNDYTEIAIKYGHLKIVKYLYNIGIKPTKRMMYYANLHLQVDIVHFLYECGIPHEPNAIRYAKHFGNQKMISYLEDFQSK